MKFNFGNLAAVLAAASLLTLAGCGGGDDGATGLTGAEGLSALTLLAPEPAGASCTTGGTKIMAGLDANVNKQLDTSEVSFTDYACNGEAGSSGLNSVLVVADEAAGANCEFGGSKVTSGLDANANAVLDSAEITKTVYTCNGAEGPVGQRGPIGQAGLNSLINSVAEPAGANCLAGGTKITVGLDTDRDGLLDTEEVTSTSYTCSAVGLPVTYTWIVNGGGDLTSTSANGSSTMTIPAGSTVTFDLDASSVTGDFSTCSRYFAFFAQVWDTMLNFDSNFLPNGFVPFPPGGPLLFAEPIGYGAICETSSFERIAIPSFRATIVFTVTPPGYAGNFN